MFNYMGTFKTKFPELPLHFIGEQLDFSSNLEILSQNKLHKNQY